MNRLLLSQRFPRWGRDDAQMPDTPSEPADPAQPGTGRAGDGEPGAPPKVPPRSAFTPSSSARVPPGDGVNAPGAVGAAGTDPIPVVQNPVGGRGWPTRPGGALPGPGWDERSRLYSSGSTSSPHEPSGDPAYPWGGPAAGAGPRPYGGPWGGAVFPPGGAAGSGVVTGAPRQPRSAHHRGRGTLLAAATVAVAVAAGSTAGVFGARLTSGAGTDPLARLNSAVAAAGGPAAVGSVEQVAAVLLPSVVSVLSSSSAAAAEGSGIILTSDGLILTNNHVISGARSLQVQFNDGSTAQAAVVGADGTDDLAVIRAAGVSGLTPATLGTSADLRIGQAVVAVGSPLGLSATVTSGIVSALNRPVRASSDQQQLPGLGQGQTQSQDTVMDAIQTDAAINPGNSGGPLVDLTGSVIAVNAAIASLSSTASSQGGSIGVGFAIPIDQATRIAQEIIDTGHATRAVLGAAVSDATTGANGQLTVGATIGQVTPGGPADTAGLKTGDVITKIGDRRIDSADALVADVRATPPNTAVTITYTRGTDSSTVTVTFGSAAAN